jgi:hypothetical protein
MKNQAHYIWIGGSDIPELYINNFQKCIRINPDFDFTIWRTNECLQLVEEYKLMEVFKPLTFICKCNFLKYLILHKFGGVYTDFDIEWKHPFSKIMNNYNFPGGSDLVLTSVDPTLMDDPFIIAKPNIMGKCITYCKNRTNLKYDGDLYKKTGVKKTHDLEPFGPFGLTSWLQTDKVNFTFFPQETLLDHNGFFGTHQQKGNWKQI